MFSWRTRAVNLLQQFFLTDVLRAQVDAKLTFLTVFRNVGGEAMARDAGNQAFESQKEDGATNKDKQAEDGEGNKHLTDAVALLQGHDESPQWETGKNTTESGQEDAYPER